MAVTATIKSLPSTYNLDFQEITPKLWESIAVVQASLDMVHKLLPKLIITADVSTKVSASFVAATELANLLTRNYSVSFRTAHKIVGSLVKSLIDEKLTLADATPESLQKTAKDIAGISLVIKAEDLQGLVNPLKLVETHNVKGGPAPSEVKRALAARQKQLFANKSTIIQFDKELDEAENTLDSTIKSYLPIET